MSTSTLRPVCFMVMPFGIKTVEPKPDNGPDKIDFDALWNKALVPLIAELGYEPVRADQDTCLLYTSDAADERSSVDLGGRRIIKKKNTEG